MNTVNADLDGNSVTTRTLIVAILFFYYDPEKRFDTPFGFFLFCVSYELSTIQTLRAGIVYEAPCYVSA